MSIKVLVSLLFLTGSVAASEPPVPAGDPTEGLRVASRVGCNGCHGADGSGRELWEEQGSFKLYSPNLTVRRDLYDDQQLDGLLRQGQTHDGHVPFGMPILMLQHLSDQEVRDISAWLRSLPAAENPDLKESWFSDETRNQLETGTHPYQEDTSPDSGNQPPAEPPTDTMALGKHLAMSSCTECHGRDLNGFEGDSAPPLIIAKAYSTEDFARLMKTGITISGTESASGLMTQTSRLRFSSMSDEEVSALKLYLDSR